MTTLREAVVDLCQAVGLEVHGDMVYGPLDSIAQLLDLTLFPDEQECSEATKLFPLAKAIAEEHCAESNFACGKVEVKQ